MKQTYLRFKSPLLFLAMVLCIACTFNACNNTKETTTEEMNSVDSTTMAMPMEVDSLPIIDTTAKSRPDGTNN